MNLLKNRPTYQILIVLNSLQEFQFSEKTALNRLSFFEVQKAYPSIRREDFFIGYDCTWSNVLMRLEEYQLLANLKQFELNLYYCNGFKREIESYKSKANCINFHDCCVKREELDREFKIIEDQNAKVVWKKIEIDQLIPPSKGQTPSREFNLLRQEPRLMLA